MTRVSRSLGFVLMALAVLLLTTLPVSSEAQLVASLVLLAGMAGFKYLRPDGPWRVVALCFGMAIVVRYVYWRTTTTLPPINQPENFIPGALLYLAEMYSVMMLVLSLFVVALPLRPRASRPLPEGKAPTVDIFIPTYDEDAHLLINTIAAAQAIDYPKERVTIWLLDDGSTDQKRQSVRILEATAAERRHEDLKRICDEFGINYLTRARNEHAKAGNLNNGLAHSTGELVAIFDADHAPATDFLKETVGHFSDDPRLFLVQTPHYFLNPDPLERNLDTFDRMPSENEMFYGMIQRGLDKWDASFFCGSAAVLRRSALLENNGFNGLSITEDCETAIELHARGWHSAYVDKPLIAGLQPATFTSFIGQRSRWAQGMMQILLLRVPFFKRGLSLPQRLCYMSSTLYWLFPLPRIAFLLSPLFYLFFGLEIFTASGAEFLSYTLSYMVAHMILQNYLYGEFRWPLISELYEYVQSIYLFPAILSVIRNPHKPTFKVTAKNESISESYLSSLSTPFFVIFGILVAAVFVTGWRLWFEPYKADVTAVVGGWNLVNLLVAGSALGVISERGQRRAATRRVQVNRRCEVRAGDAWLAGTIENVSVGGCRIRVAGVARDTFLPGQATDVRITMHNDTIGTLPLLVRSVAGGEGGTLAFGVCYEPHRVEHHRVVADLVFANSQQWSELQKARRGNPGILVGTLRFIGIAIYQTGRGLFYASRLVRLEGEKLAERNRA